MSINHISQKGENVLVREEGEVLRAYRCPAGVLTIGVGLTAASGVITPKMGMTITKEESRILLKRALEKNYIPRVKKAGLDTSQNVFDGAVSFDFNTGRIHNATWVKRFLAGSLSLAETSFKAWNKGGGKVLTGLVRRRATEWEIIAENKYPAWAGESPAAASKRPKAVKIEPADVTDIQVDLNKLGYDAGEVDGVMGPRTSAAVKTFQAAEGLTVDGIPGPATKAALKRALEKKKQNEMTAAGGGGGVAAGGGAETINGGGEPTEILMTALTVGVGIALLVAGCYLLWRYRGPLFAWLPEGVKDFFEDRGIVVGRRIRT